jgi:hypothetical protein
MASGEGSRRDRSKRGEDGGSSSELSASTASNTTLKDMPTGITTDPERRKRERRERKEAKQRKKE